MKLKIVVLFVFMLPLLLSFSVIVYAGYLNATRTLGSEGTTFTIEWRQGFGRGMVYYLDGTNYFTRTLNLGPNSCNLAGSQGNDRAIHVNISADASGPFTPDARVNCNECPCEPIPNTNFECRESGVLQGRCISCNACTSYPCEDWADCTHNTCISRTCTCNDDKCSNDDPRVRACDGTTETTCACNADKSDCVCVTNPCGGGGPLPPACRSSCQYGWDALNGWEEFTRCENEASNDIRDYKGPNAVVEGWSILWRAGEPSPNRETRIDGDHYDYSSCPSDVGDWWVRVWGENSITGDIELMCERVTIDCS